MQNTVVAVLVTRKLILYRFLTSRQWNSFMQIQSEALNHLKTLNECVNAVAFMQ